MIGSTSREMVMRLTWSNSHHFEFERLINVNLFKKKIMNYVFTYHLGSTESPEAVPKGSKFGGKLGVVEGVTVIYKLTVLPNGWGGVSVADSQDTPLTTTVNTLVDGVIVTFEARPHVLKSSLNAFNDEQEPLYTVIYVSSSVPHVSKATVLLG